MRTVTKLIHECLSAEVLKLGLIGSIDCSTHHATARCTVVNKVKLNINRLNTERKVVILKTASHSGTSELHRLNPTKQIKCHAVSKALSWCQTK